MSGRPAATTRLATDTPFSSEKNPTAWDTTSERRITSRKATRITAAAMPSAGVGSEREWTGRLPTTKNPNTEMAMASSTMVATPRRLLAARSTRASRSSRSTMAGTSTTLSTNDKPAST